MQMNPIHRRTHDAFFVQVADRIGQSIIDGTYPIGGTLPRESDLAIEHDVGRSAIREALKMLAAKGLIESRPRRGTLVRPPGMWNMFDPDVQGWLQRTRPTKRLMRELMEIREAFEPAAAALAAKRLTDDTRRRVKDAMVRLDDAGRGLVDPYDADVEFHAAVIEATDNRFFTALVPLVATALLFNYRAAAAATRDDRDVATRHKPVAEALLKGDAETARTATVAFLKGVRTVMESLALPDGEGGAAPRARAGKAVRV
jgi:DNA-binding FadR family transcriptional regulator